MSISERCTIVSLAAMQTEKFTRTPNLGNKKFKNLFGQI